MDNKQTFSNKSLSVAVPLMLVLLLLLFIGACKLINTDRPSGHTKTNAASGVSSSDIDAAFAKIEAKIHENPLKDAYFGDTHVHTSFSLDAFIGGTRLTPNDAYRFAKGENVSLNNMIHNIRKPLDFSVVTDHAEYIGELYSTQMPDAPGHLNKMLIELRGLSEFEKQEAWFVEYVMKNNRSGEPAHPPFYAGLETTKSAWQDIIIKAAQDHYEPGRFTTLIGFEWTAAPNGGNMHRNVIFRDSVVPEIPITSIDTSDEEKLWKWMADQENNGSTLLAIPHNSNASKTQMFEPVDNSGAPLTEEYARNRSKWEPLIEMMQIKGNSEVVQSLWTTDEFADFENAQSLTQYSDRIYKKENFVRWGVTKGLAYKRDLGTNPYKLGFIGGTDTHNGTPGDVVENNFIGSHGGADGTIERRRKAEVTGWLQNRDGNPGSLAGVWAKKNTRGAIWDAMKERETFVTSGTRIKPRFFGGVGLSAGDAPEDMVKQGYRKGVPMGGTLKEIETAPTFTVYAAKETDGANLDRIQIIKGWVDKSGEPQDKIINVVWSGNRKLDADGKLPPVGNTVDLKTATFTNAIGRPFLMGSWTDDEFNPDEHALYYVRVLEIPTPRWTTYDAVKNNLPLLKDVPSTIQERAWSSPIWYTPQNKTNNKTVKE